MSASSRAISRRWGAWKELAPAWADGPPPLTAPRGPGRRGGELSLGPIADFALDSWTMSLGHLTAAQEQCLGVAWAARRHIASCPRMNLFAEIMGVVPCGAALSGARRRRRRRGGEGAQETRADPSPSTAPAGDVLAADVDGEGAEGGQGQERKQGGGTVGEAQFRTGTSDATYRYSPRLGVFVLHLMERMMPQLSASTLRVQPPGLAWASVATAEGAVRAVFPQEHTPRAGHFLALPAARVEAVVHTVREAARAPPSEAASVGTRAVDVDEVVAACVREWRGADAAERDAWAAVHFAAARRLAGDDGGRPSLVHRGTLPFHAFTDLLLTCQRKYHDASFSLSHRCAAGPRPGALRRLSLSLSHIHPAPFQGEHGAVRAVCGAGAECGREALAGPRHGAHGVDAPPGGGRGGGVRGG